MISGEVQERNIGKGILAGVVGGLIGTIVMTQFQNALSAASQALKQGDVNEKQESDQKSQSKPEAEDSTMKAAGKITAVAGTRFLTNRRKSSGRWCTIRSEPSSA